MHEPMINHLERTMRAFVNLVYKLEAMGTPQDFDPELGIAQGVIAEAKAIAGGPPLPPDIHDPYSSLWLTLVPLLSEENLVRLIRRAELRLPEESQRRSDLITYLDAELRSREAVAALQVPPLKSQV